MSQPRFEKLQILYLKRLLNMQYKPNELAGELGVNVRTVYRTYIDAGCPHSKDKSGRLWINGTEFRKWAETIIASQKPQTHMPLQPDQAYCLRCKQVVTVDRFTLARGVNSGVDLYKGSCPVCRRDVFKAQSKKSPKVKRDDLPSELARY